MISARKMGVVAVFAVLLGAGAMAEPLPRIGPAPEFELTAQDGNRLSLADLKGKVVAVTFIYTACPDVCPLLSHKLLGVQEKLADTGYADVFFVSITMDPERDTPAHLDNYVGWLGADRERWAFLSGTETEVRDVARDYGVYFNKQDNGVIDHNLLTSIVDRSGALRVQYIGSRFDPDEFLRDLQMVSDEDG